MTIFMSESGQWEMMKTMFYWKGDKTNLTSYQFNTHNFLVHKKYKKRKENYKLNSIISVNISLGQILNMYKDM